MLLRGDTSDPVAGAGSRDDVTTDAGLGSVTTGSTAATGTTDDGTSTPSEPLSDDPIDPGRYVQVGSFRGAPRAEEEADRLRAAGLDADVYDTNAIVQLQPAFFVILAGPFAGSAGEDRAVGRARRAGIAGARRHFLEPATETDPPAGYYDGTLSRKAAAGSPMNREIAATMDFSSDGQSATATFATPRCRSELQLSGTAGATWTYDETVTSGDCLSGGTWSAKSSGSELRLTWWHPDRTYFVVGTLTGG